MGVFEQGRLRSSPAYELVLLDQLSPAERDSVGRAGGEGTYGVLRPRPGADLEPRTASTDVALLFLTLAEPQPLPGYARDSLGSELERTIARLVLDGVLELEQEGGFVSGAAAAHLLATAPAAGGRGRIGELSTAALRYGQWLGPLEEELLATRLYLYGRIPISAALRDRWPDEAAVAAQLGVDRGGEARAALEGTWVEAPGREGADHWRSWRPLHAGGRSRSRTGTGCKLYVSPTIEALPGAVAAVATELRGIPGLGGFKVGRDLAGICRPDKLVVYFDRLDDLQRAGEALREQLDGCPAHGVPFTAPLTPDGLLSWGADPPAESTGDGGRSSWRLWIAARLAEYLVRGRRSGGDGPEPWRFALERLRLAGVDTDTWAPRNGIWPAAGAG